jgi:hypothetical protein
MGAGRTSGGTRSQPARAGNGETTLPIPSFLIVGTARSGTTLVQRLACELPGVSVPPETHFFAKYAKTALVNFRFPLEGEVLRTAVEAFTELKTSGELDVDVNAIVRDLDGRCLRLVDLFSTIVRQLAGDATTYGEKTPRHLLWWRPVTSAIPGLKIVAVVRDPRAVVASHFEVPWFRERPNAHVLLAELWRFQQGQVLTASRTLGDGRCLILRYEDIVRDPVAARASLAGFLGIQRASGDPEVGLNAMRTAILPHESWKIRVLEGITADRSEIWREKLSARAAAQIAGICRRPMIALGYQAGSTTEAILAAAPIPPRMQILRMRSRLAMKREVNGINRIRV